MKMEDRGEYGRRMRRVLPVVLVGALILSLQSVAAQTQMETGSATVGNTLQNGVTSYDLEYTHPTVAQVGQNLTIEATLHVNQFSGQVEYIAAYTLLAEVFIGDNYLSANTTVAAGPNYLYPGGNWGPLNLTVPLTATDTGIPTGSSVNATVSLTLSDYVYVGIPYLTYVTEPPMTGQAGSVIIQNDVATVTTSSNQGSGSGNGSSTTAYVLLGAGVVLMVFAVVLPRGPKAPPT
jgi:hypothetical protein